MNNDNFKNAIVKYVVLSAILLILPLGRINGLNPFALPAYLSAVFVGCNALLLAPSLIIGEFLAVGDWLMTAATALGAVIAITFDFFMRRIDKKYGIVMMIIITIVSLIPCATVSALKGSEIVYIAVNVSLSLIFAYVSYGIFRPLLYFKMKHKLLGTEATCLYIVLVAVSMGVSSINVTASIPLYFFVGACLPLSVRFSGKGACASVAIAIGLGNAFNTLDVVAVALFAFAALAVCMFASAPKIIIALSEAFACVIFELFFSVPYYDLGYHAAAILAGGLLCAFIPEKALESIFVMFFPSGGEAAVRHLVNRNRAELAKAALSVGDVFAEMSSILGGMEKTGDSAVVNIAKEVTKSVCLGCERYAECKNEGLEECMLHVAGKTFERGRCSMSDLPYLLVDKCLYIGRIMSICSGEVKKLDMSVESIECDNKVTKLLSEQLFGVSRILKSMGENVGRPVGFDDKVERRIAEELRYYNIVCSEALISFGQKPCATLIIRSECVGNKKLISEVAGKCAGVKFYVRSITDGSLPGWSVVELEESPALDVTFGVSSRPLRSDATGDTHSFMKIGGDKFLMAVCDGMGSGKKAYDLSNKAMSLVEGFYRAGFDHEITVDGINRFLSIEEGESFSALDISVCDLSKGKADLVKLAAPPSFVKRADGVEKFDSESLPLGVVEGAEPFIRSCEIADGDGIVIVSDGVSSRFKEGELESVINNTQIINPQLAADTLLSRALEKKGVPDDDMTVAVCRIFRRI